MEPWREELYHSELYHYGVLGQRWGIRNYQNKDGSLTLAGKLRYRASSVDKIKSKKGTMNRLEDLNIGIKKNRRYTKINEFLEKRYRKKYKRNRDKYDKMHSPEYFEKHPVIEDLSSASVPKQIAAVHRYARSERYRKGLNDAAYYEDVYRRRAAKTAEYERKGREEYNRLMGNLSPNDLVKMTPAYKKQQRELKKQRKQIKKMKRRL